MCSSDLHVQDPHQGSALANHSSKPDVHTYELDAHWDSVGRRARLDDMSDLSHMADTAPGPDDAPVRFGVIGAGFIAHWFAEAVAREPAAQIVAITSAHRERAAAFAEEHGIPHTNKNQRR